MAAGNITLFNLAKLKIHQKKFDFSADTFKGVLTTSSQALTAAFAGTSTDARLSDLTAEITGGGYARQTLASVTLAQAAGVVTWDAADLTYPALTNTFTYLVIYDDTAANDDLICFVDLNTTGDITTGGEDFIVKFDALGIFTAT